jgi:1-acyl-sn-glycerol-3-phosphate acyltransferase
MFAPLFGIDQASGGGLVSSALDLSSIQMGYPVFSPAVIITVIILVVIMAITWGWQNIGATYVLRGLVRGDPVFVFSDFFYAIKKNLKQGFLLAIFPQGQINKDDNINQVKSGAVLMAIRSNTPIIPMYIAPRKKWYHSRTVIIGDPIYPRKICTKAFPSAADLEKITLILSEELNHCKLSSENP